MNKAILTIKTETNTLFIPVFWHDSNILEPIGPASLTEEQALDEGAPQEYGSSPSKRFDELMGYLYSNYKIKEVSVRLREDPSVCSFVSANSNKDGLYVDPLPLQNFLTVKNASTKKLSLKKK